MPVSAVRRPCRPGSLYPPNVYSEWAPHVDLSRVDLSKIDSYWGHLVFKDPKVTYLSVLRGRAVGSTDS